MCPRVVAMVVLLAGCGASRAPAPCPAPAAAVDRLATSIQAADYHRAYALMPEAFRATYTEQDFEHLMDGELVTLAPRVSAKLCAGGDTDYPMATPRDSLASFFLAYDRKRWDLMLEFVPTKYREHLNQAAIKRQFAEARNRKVIELLESQLADAVIQQDVDEATWSYGSGSVKLIREDGRWKIQDLE